MTATEFCLERIRTAGVMLGTVQLALQANDGRLADETMQRLAAGLEKLADEAGELVGVLFDDIALAHPGRSSAGPAGPDTRRFPTNPRSSP